MVVQKVVDELMQKLEQRTISAIRGAINKSSQKRNPKYNEIDWNTTIKKNLKHYQPDYKTTHYRRVTKSSNSRALPIHVR